MPTHVGERQSVLDHLQELRSRLLSSLAFLFVGTLVGYFIHDFTLEVLVRPLHQPLYYASPTGGFDLVLKLSFLFGFVTAIPILTLHILRFIEPALPHRSARRPFVIIVASCWLLIVGMAFAYTVSLPAALHFLNTFAPANVHALISTEDYLSFVARYLLGFGLLFQLPLVMWLVNSIVRISTRQLLGYQKWVILISFIVAAVLTPTPDVVNQLIMAIPLILLYQITIVFLWLINRGERTST